MRTFTVCFFLLLSAAFRAQGNDRITLTDGKTIQADIRPLSPVMQALSVAFVTGGELRTLEPEEVEAFTRIKSARKYRSVSVSLPQLKASGSNHTQRRFAEILAEGDVELLKVYLSVSEYDSQAAGSQPYLYLLRIGSEEVVLKLTSIYVYERLHANPSRFRNVLKFLVRGCPVAIQLASTASFEDANILEVISAYKKCNSSLSITLNEKRLRGGINVDHYGQMMHVDIRDGDFNNRQFSGGFGYQAVTRFTERYEWLSVMASAHYIYHSFRWQEQSDISQSMIRGNISLGFFPLLRKNYSLQLTGGLSNYNAFSSSFRSFFSNNYFMINGGVNLLYRDWLVGVNYETLPGQISRRPGNQLLATVGYRFK